MSDLYKSAAANYRWAARQYAASGDADKAREMTRLAEGEDRKAKQLTDGWHPPVFVYEPPKPAANTPPARTVPPKTTTQGSSGGGVRAYRAD